MLARISLSTSNLDGARVAPNRGIPSRTRPCTSSCLERFPLRGHPRIPVHHAQELPIGGKLPSYFILKSLTQSFPLEWRDVLRYQRLRKLHADLHAANCAPLRDPFGADPARLLGRGLSRQQVMARAARHRESDAASRRAYVWADVATRFGGTSEGLARICRCSINVVLAEPGLADALWTRHGGCVRYGSSTVTTSLLIGRRSDGGSKNGQANRAGAPAIRRRCRCRTPIRCRVQEAKLSSAS